MKKCLCCGYFTIEGRGGYDICPVCFWEDDAYLIFEEDSINSVYLLKPDITEEMLMDIPSGANHGLTLREGKENYKKFGACEKSMKQYVRPPKKSEKFE